MTRGLALYMVALVGAGGVLGAVLTTRSRSGWRKLEAEMEAETQVGALQPLLRARVAGLRLMIARPDSAEVAADLAHVSAVLADQYGLPTAREAEVMAARAEAGAGGPAAAALGAARALLALGRGDRAGAEALALAAADRDRDDIRPLLALARIRQRAGDLAAASATWEAAIVKAPAAAGARTSWAEARIDLGQPGAAIEALRAVLAQAPEDTRARLLLDEALGARLESPTGGETQALLAGCRRDSAASPVVAAGCALRTAVGARLRGERAVALAQARAAAAAAIADPRLLAGIALELGQLGQIDAAEALVARAAARSGPGLPALGWARVALALGRGEVARPGPALRAESPATRLLAARAALAAGGHRALASALADIGAAAVRADPDLGALAALAAPGPSPAQPPAGAEAGADPVRAYAQGLRARLGGAPQIAVAWLAGALDGHGDACRAAGEYVAAMGLLERPLGKELEPLRAANAGCINLAPPRVRAKPRPTRPGKRTARR
jgi:hypothetical protein